MWNRLLTVVFAWSPVLFQACSDPAESPSVGPTDTSTTMNERDDMISDSFVMNPDARLESDGNVLPSGDIGSEDPIDAGHGTSDLCESHRGDCDTNARCMVIEGSVACICRDGYEGDGRTCYDVDECADNHGDCGDPGFVRCVNQVGGLPLCEDINECLTDNGGCGDPQFGRCINNDRSAPDCADINQCDVDHGGCGSEDHVQCIHQPGEPPTCRAYTLVDLWTGRAHFELDLIQDQIGWNGFHFLSALWHDDRLHAYFIANYESAGRHRAAVGLAVSDDGLDFEGRGVVLDVGGAWQWIFDAADLMHHNIGRADADGWSVGVNDGAPAYLAFGPYVALPQGPMTVSFRLMVDVVESTDDRVVTLDIFDATAQRIVATRDITRHQFSRPFEYATFAMPYEQIDGHEMEFRVFWHGNSYVRLGQRSVSQGHAPFPDERLASFPGIWKQDDHWYLVYECAGLTEEWPGDICLSTSDDGVTWLKSPSNPILTHQGPGWERINVGTPSLWHENDTWYLFYHGFDGQRVQIGLASGPDLENLSRHQDNPILRNTPGTWDAGTIGKRSIIKEGDWYYMAYEGSTEKRFNPSSADPLCQVDPGPDNQACIDFGGADWSTGLARSQDLVNWQTFALNPILPSTDSSFGYDGAEFIRTPDGRLHLYYRAPGPGNQTKRATLTRSDEN